MCEYCNCQEIDAIAVLTSEHDAIRSAGREVKVAARAGDHPGAVAAIGRLTGLLAPHTRIEELGLFPAMAVEFGDHVAGLEHDHRDLETELAELAAAPVPGPDWVDRLDRALRTLFDHILREQDGLFPAALATLEPEQWEQLDAVRRDVESSQAQPETVGYR